MAEERAEPALLLLLDHLQDPQNIGTLLRTAETVGVHGVVMPGRRAAEVTPAVVNASSGATEHLRIADRRQPWPSRSPRCRRWRVKCPVPRTMQTP